jgi:hypothetical protein
MTLGGMLGVSGCVAWIASEANPGIGPLFVLGVGIALGAAAGLGIGRMRMPVGTRLESDKNKHPAIQRMKADGWEIGEKPTGVS